MLFSALSKHPRRQYWNKMLVVGVLYYAEGLPYGFLFKTLSYYLATENLSLTAIGLAGLLHLPWTLKFIWAPLVDRFGKRSAWMLGCQVALIAGMAITPWLAVGSLLFMAMLAMVAVAGATQDIAIDAYTIDILEPEEQGPANGVRAATYRVALIAAGGLMIWLSEYLGWTGSLMLFAASLGLVSLVVLLWPAAHAPRPAEQAASRQSLAAAARLAWLGIVRIPNLWAVVLFILCFKAGEAFLGQMVGPFWHHAGFSRAQFGLVSGTLGTGLTIVGSLWGGVLCKRWGLWRSLWILGGLQAISNLGYAYAALNLGQAIPTYGASMVESFCGGLGNAPFLTLLMRLCNRQASAGQYAILSAVFGLSGTVASSLSGLVAQQLGFTWFFSLSFLVALPAFAFLPFLPMRRDKDSSIIYRPDKKP